MRHRPSFSQRNKKLSWQRRRRINEFDSTSDLPVNSSCVRRAHRECSRCRPCARTNALSRCLYSSTNSMTFCCRPWHTSMTRCFSSSTPSWHDIHTLAATWFPRSCSHYWAAVGQVRWSRASSLHCSSGWCHRRDVPQRCLDERQTRRLVWHVWSRQATAETARHHGSTGRWALHPGRRISV